MLLGLFSAIGANAQFVNPVTPDEFACSASNVANTGTSAIEDLQVIVYDGDEPGIIFVDYTTNPPTSHCFLLEAFVRNARVSDPDVVWDYSGSGLVMVVYESDYLQSQGIWSEVWDWNSGSPQLHTSFGSFAGMELISARGGETYPNIDADIHAKAVVVYERTGEVFAQTFDFFTLNFGTIEFEVSDCNPGANSREPDVAMRIYNVDEAFVTITYVHTLGGQDEVVILSLDYSELFSVSSNSVGTICGVPEREHFSIPITGFTGLHNPRVAMPWFIDVGPASFDYERDASVVYEIRNASRRLIGSAQRWTRAGWCTPFSAPFNFYCSPQTYSIPLSFTSYTHWFEEIINAIEPINHPFPALAPNPPPIPQGIAPAVDLRDDSQNRPVTAHGGDLIVYHAWNWYENVTSQRGFGLEEVLSRRMLLNYEPNQISDAGNLYEMVYPMAMDTTYFVVGTGYTVNQRQEVVSVAGTLTFAYYTFWDKDNGVMAFKRSAANAFAAVRQAGPNQLPMARLLKEDDAEFTIYPNPTEGIVHIKGVKTGSLLEVRNLQGKLILSDIFSDFAILDLKSFGLNSGLYLLTLKDTNGKIRHEKVVVK